MKRLICDQATIRQDGKVIGNCTDIGEEAMGFRGLAWEARRRREQEQAWRKGHLVCPHIFQDSQRGSLSRTYLCSYSCASHRCMFRLCPALLTRPWVKR